MTISTEAGRYRSGWIATSPSTTTRLPPFACQSGDQFPSGQRPGKRRALTGPPCAIAGIPSRPRRCCQCLAGVVGDWIVRAIHRGERLAQRSERVIETAGGTAGDGIGQSRARRTSCHQCNAMAGIGGRFGAGDEGGAQLRRLGGARRSTSPRSIAPAARRRSARCDVSQGARAARSRRSRWPGCSISRW